MNLKIILNKPKYGLQNQAEYTYYGNKKLYVYVDSACSGLRPGSPTQELKYSIIPEFIEIAIGQPRRQIKSTAFLKPKKLQQVLQNFLFD